MNTKYSILKSREDSSVNFIAKGDFPGLIEARYVRRNEDYFIVYLSPQTGCKQACRMCHLTATGQTQFVDVAPEQFVRQAQTVLEYYDTMTSKAHVVHFNFMARGEALANKYLLADSTSILRPLECMALGRSLQPKYLISTIMPATMKDRQLIDVFPAIHPEIYYSLYSMKPTFRKRWLPKALPAETGLHMLSAWQQQTGKVPKIHFAFIKDENDSEEDIELICKAVNNLGLLVHVNIVRYNSFSEKQGIESDEATIDRNVALFQRYLSKSEVRIINRVGFDVKASCGMFIEKSS